MAAPARTLLRTALRGVAAPRASSSALVGSIHLPAARSLHQSARRLAVSTRYTKEHEWVKFDDSTNVGTVGITDYAQNSLGDVVFVEITATGKQVEKGSE